MHAGTGDQPGPGPPAKFAMLVVGCHPGVRGHCDFVGQYHVMGTDTFDGKKIVIIKVFVNTLETDDFG